MTAAQMAYEFQVGFDNITNLSAEIGRAHV